MSDADTSEVRWRLCTPGGAAGAIAIIQIDAREATSLDDAFARLGIARVDPGTLCVRELCGLDRGVVARWTETCAQLMPHGGVEVVRSIIGCIERVGIRRASESDDPLVQYPEARDVVEARMLVALARATSPLAIDLLLDQPRRWRGIDPGVERSAPEAARDAVLNRLLEPALVAIVGPPNIGKSTLLNTLAGRQVSIVADEAGTTRDHVGVRIDVGGVVASVVDVPGIRESDDPLERSAIEAARVVIERADVLILAGDPTTPPLPESMLPQRARETPRLRVCLRADLGAGNWTPDLRVCARSGEGVADFVGMVRECLVPRSAIEDAGAWKFW